MEVPPNNMTTNSTLSHISSPRARISQSFLDSLELLIFVHQVAAKVELTSCQLKFTNVTVVPVYSAPPCHFLNVHVDRSFLSHCKLVISLFERSETSIIYASLPLHGTGHYSRMARSTISVVYFHISDSSLHSTSLYKYDPVGLVGFYIHRCLWYQTCQMMKALNIFQFEIYDSEIIYDTHKDCFFHMRGTDTYEITEQWVRDLVLSVFQPYYYQYFPHAIFESMIFRYSGHQTVQFGSLISCDYLDVYMFHSMIHFGNSTIPPSWRLIHVTNLFHGINITVDLKDARPLASHFLVFSMSFGYVLFNDIRLLCPQGYNMAGAGFRFGSKLASVSCEKRCQKDQYSLQAGEALIDMHKYGDKLANKSEPTCFPCPVGSQCDQRIISLPNYWGYKNGSDYVTIIRCPDGYCCQDKESCIGIDSCAPGRTGTLCGICEQNLTESFLSPSCIPTENCSNSLLIALYFLGAISYAVALLVADIAKKVLGKIGSILKVAFKKVKNIERPIESTASKDLQTIPEVSSTSFAISEHESTSAMKETGIDRSHHTDFDKDNEGMKYMQILFYYVQDASLFRVNLSNEQTDKESVLVKFIQFSPDILVAAYDRLSVLCFSSGSAYTKLLLQALFGPTAILVLCLIYLTQIIISSCFWKQSKFWMKFKVAITQAVVISLLFCYQKLATSVFTLIQCVQVQDISVLYIQGDIECYTWWQHVFRYTVWLNLLPFFFVVSHCPYYVKDKKMSVREFIAACFFPMPVILYKLFSKSLNFSKPCSSKSKPVVRNERYGQNTIKDSHETDSEGDSKFEKGQGQKLLQVFEILHHRKKKQASTEVNLELEEMASKSIPTEVIVSETSSVHSRSNSTSSSENNEEENNSEKVILHSLLRHYRCLKLFGIRFTWLGVHKLYRLILVACHTYITEPLYRLYIMTGLLVVLCVISTVIKPYKDRKANVTSILSYTANLCIAIINIGKVNMLTFDCKSNCPLQSVFARYLDTIQRVLLVYVPLAAAVVWMVFTGVQKCRPKKPVKDN